MLRLKYQALSITSMMTIPLALRLPVHSNSATVLHKGAFVNEWRVNPFDGTVPQSPDPANPDSGDPIVLNNAPAMERLFAIPSDLRYYMADRERERTNAQLTFQFAPSEKMTATLDYTYSKQDLYEARAEQSIWMDDRYFTELTFDDETVKTPVLITQERELLPRDLGLALQELNQVNENKSIGLNLGTS